MKYMTIADVNALQEQIIAKTDMLNAYTRMANGIRANYKDMTDDQLVKAILEVNTLKADIASFRAWIQDAKKKIANFYKVNA